MLSEPPLPDKPVLEPGPPGSRQGGGPRPGADLRFVVTSFSSAEAPARVLRPQRHGKRLDMLPSKFGLPDCGDRAEI